MIITIIIFHQVNLSSPTHNTSHTLLLGHHSLTNRALLISSAMPIESRDDLERQQSVLVHLDVVGDHLELRVPLRRLEHFGRQMFHLVRAKIALELDEDEKQNGGVDGGVQQRLAGQRAGEEVGFAFVGVDGGLHLEEELELAAVGAHDAVEAGEAEDVRVLVRAEDGLDARGALEQLKVENVVEVDVVALKNFGVAAAIEGELNRCRSLMMMLIFVGRR